MPPISPDIKQEVDQVFEAIVYLYTESRRLTKELARRAQLTGPQLTVVKILESIGDLSLSELSDKIRAQNSTVTGIIDRMERDGIVLRRRSDEDRRVIHIALTAKGKKLAASAKTDPMHLFRALLEDLAPKDAAELERIMTKLASRVRGIIAETERAEDGRESEPPPRLVQILASDRGKSP